MQVKFLDEIQQAISEINKQYSIHNQLLQLSLSVRNFDEYQKMNQFRHMSNLLSEQLMGRIHVFVAHEYNDAGVSAMKIPEYGVNDDFSFHILGNEDYDRVATDRYLTRGNIYTSKDTLIVPSPEEETEGQTLLFRTSHGETIKGHPFISMIVSDFYKIHSPLLINSYTNDVISFLKR